MASGIRFESPVAHRNFKSPCVSPVKRRHSQRSSSPCFNPVKPAPFGRSSADQEYFFTTPTPKFSQHPECPNTDATTACPDSRFTDDSLPSPLFDAVDRTFMPQPLTPAGPCMNGLCSYLEFYNNPATVNGAPVLATADSLSLRMLAGEIDTCRPAGIDSHHVLTLSLEQCLRPGGVTAALPEPESWAEHVLTLPGSIETLPDLANETEHDLAVPAKVAGSFMSEAPADAGFAGPSPCTPLLTPLSTPRGRSPVTSIPGAPLRMTRAMFKQSVDSGIDFGNLEAPIQLEEAPPLPGCSWATPTGTLRTPMQSYPSMQPSFVQLLRDADDVAWLDELPWLPGCAAAPTSAPAMLPHRSASLMSPDAPVKSTNLHQDRFAAGEFATALCFDDLLDVSYQERALDDWGESVRFPSTQDSTDMHELLEADWSMVATPRGARSPVLRQVSPPGAPRRPRLGEHSLRKSPLDLPLVPPLPYLSIDDTIVSAVGA